MMSERRLRKRAARRNQMLDAALNIALEEGVESLTIAKIAKSLDAAVGAIYRYFPSKAALLVGLQIQALDLFHSDMRAEHAAMKEALVSRGEDPETSPAGVLCQILGLIHSYLDDAERAPDRHRLIDALISTPTPLLDAAGLEEVSNSLKRVLDIISAVLKGAESRGVLAPGDADQRTHVLWAATHGLDHFRKRDRIAPENLKVRVLTDATASALLLGWGAEAQAIERAIELCAETRGSRP